jgi:putative membrane protein
VFLIVLKDALSMLWGLLGLFAIMILLMLGIRLYKKLRKD